MNIGILGGGQLACMLADAARSIGHRVTVLSRKDEPAADSNCEIVTGELSDAAAVEELFRRCEVVTIENEFVDVGLIRELQVKYPHVRFMPTASALELTQDKLAQKQLFQRCGLGTAVYRVLSEHPTEEELRRVTLELGGKVVLKFSRGGYDGKGVMPWGADDDPAEALAFWARAVETNARLFAEAHVAFLGEVALVAVRHASGEFASWPLMFTRQTDGTCREVYGPAVWMGLSAERQMEAQRAANAIGSALGFCGVFAIEFFLTEDGLWVNEMAPRVHNSGHYTLNGAEESQFAAHIRAITKTGLVEPHIDKFAYMRNLLGPAAREFDAKTLDDVPPPTGVALHWYGKRRSKPKRKMGHLTGRCMTIDELRELREQTCYWELEFWSAQSQERMS